MSLDQVPARTFYLRGYHVVVVNPLLSVSYACHLAGCERRNIISGKSRCTEREREGESGKIRRPVSSYFENLPSLSEGIFISPLLPPPPCGQRAEVDITINLIPLILAIVNSFFFVFWFESLDGS